MYLPKEDAIISRNERRYSNKAVLMDREGRVIHLFDKQLTDEQIYSALELANKAFSAGVKHGKNLKALEFQRALEVIE